jgi:hypothetical protein
VEFATLLPYDEERIDAYHDGEPLRYHTMENLLSDQPVPGLAPHDLEAQLHLACDDGEPRSFAEAERHAAWRAAMQSEMDAVEKNCTWELADLPRGHSAITLKWLFKLKRDEAGVIVKHKAHLVARGFMQREGINFDDTFAPVAWMESVRLLFALAAQEGWRVHHIDVKSAFLNGDLKEGGLRASTAGIRDPWQGGQGVAPAQGPLWLAVGTAGVVCQVGLHAQVDGLRAKPARGGHLPAGQWRKRSAGGCLLRRLGDHRHQGCGGGSVRKR